MRKVNVREFLASLILLLNIEFTFTTRSLSTDVGQGTVLNSDHYPLLQGTFESFFGDGDLAIAASDRVLDWSTRKRTKANKGILKIRTKNEKSEDENRNPKSRSSREVPLPQKQERLKGGESREISDPASLEIRSSETTEKTSTPSEPTAQINFPGGLRTTNYKRKPIMTYYEKLRSRPTVSDANVTENTSEAGIPKITVRNQEQRSQKIKKRNRYRQKTMKLKTTTSVPTTWEYRTQQPRETEKYPYIDAGDFHSTDSRFLLSTEQQTESSSVPTTTTTGKARTSPTRRTSLPRKNSAAGIKIPNRGDVKFGDIIAKESGKTGLRVLPTKEAEEKDVSKPAANQSRMQSRMPHDIPRVQKEDLKLTVKNDAKEEGEIEIRSRQTKRKEEKDQKNSKFEILDDPSIDIRSSDSHHSTQGPPLPSTTTPKVVYNEQQAKMKKQDLSDKNLRGENLPPETRNSQLYSLGNPYYPRGFLGFTPSQDTENRESNGFFRQPIPYQGNVAPQPGYYFRPHTYDSGFGSDYALPGFHHSPHVLSLRHSILESQRDPSTTTEPYSFTIPNFRIPTIDYNHKGCKTLLREVKEVPVSQRNSQSFNGYQTGPRSRRIKPGVQSVVMTKECFFPDGVPEEAIQGKNAKITENSTPPISVVAVVEQERKPSKKIIGEVIPRLEKDFIDAEKVLRRKGENRGRNGMEDYLEYAPSEFHLNAPRFDPIRGYTFD